MSIRARELGVPAVIAPAAALINGEMHALFDLNAQLNASRFSVEACAVRMRE